jgi:hypothetical protein
MSVVNEPARGSGFYELSEKSKTESNSRNSDHRELVQALTTSLISGVVTVTVNNFPFLKIDGESKTLDVEIKGFEESGVRLNDILQKDSKGNALDSIRKSGNLAGSLNADGWMIRVFDGTDTLFKMGKGVSSITGHVWINPLKLPKLMKLI